MFEGPSGPLPPQSPRERVGSEASPLVPEGFGDARGCLDPQTSAIPARLLNIINLAPLCWDPAAGAPRPVVADEGRQDSVQELGVSRPIQVLLCILSTST